MHACKFGRLLRLNWDKTVQAHGQIRMHTSSKDLSRVRLFSHHVQDWLGRGWFKVTLYPFQILKTLKSNGFYSTLVPIVLTPPYIQSLYIVTCRRVGVSNKPPRTPGSDKTWGQGSFGPFTGGNT